MRPLQRFEGLRSSDAPQAEPGWYHENLSSLGWEAFFVTGEDYEE